MLLFLEVEALLQFVYGVFILLRFDVKVILYHDLK